MQDVIDKERMKKAFKKEDEDERAWKNGVKKIIE